MKNHKNTPTLGEFESVEARNKSLYKDFSSGMSIVRLVAKYQISSARIYKILEVMRGIDNSK